MRHQKPGINGDKLKGIKNYKQSSCLTSFGISLLVLPTDIPNPKPTWYIEICFSFFGTFGPLLKLATEAPPSIRSCLRMRCTWNHTGRLWAVLSRLRSQGVYSRVDSNDSASTPKSESIILKTNNTDCGKLLFLLKLPQTFLPLQSYDK